MSFTVRTLGLADEALLQRLLERCADYFQLVYGSAPTADEARTVLTELPPGKTAEDKRVQGFFGEGGALVGVMDVVRGFRTADEWYLGLLLLEPEARRGGTGSAILEALAAEAARAGARSIRLGCAEQNEAGLRFWRRHGFVDDRRFPPRVLGARETVLLELVRRVP